jgi:hypothetical protein
MEDIIQPIPAKFAPVYDGQYIEVPLSDVQAILKAWRNREGGMMNVTKLLELFERWNNSVIMTTE